jgi:hypothetical protein
MRDHTRFGVWTLVAAVSWISGIILAAITVWALWADWFRTRM